jgi:hypothetical protein
METCTIAGFSPGLGEVTHFEWPSSPAWQLRSWQTPLQERAPPALEKLKVQEPRNANVC